MKRIVTFGLITAGFLSLAGMLFASEDLSGARHLDLQRDAVYEQYLHYQASADTAITPQRVLRWLNSLMGNSQSYSHSNFEFQPIVRANNFQNQFIAQFAYKF